MLLPAPLTNAKGRPAIAVDNVSFKGGVNLGGRYHDRISAKTFHKLKVHRGDADVETLQVRSFNGFGKVEAEWQVSPNPSYKIEPQLLFMQIIVICPGPACSLLPGREVRKLHRIGLWKQVDVVGIGRMDNIDHARLCPLDLVLNFEDLRTTDKVYLQFAGIFLCDLFFHALQEKIERLVALGRVFRPGGKCFEGYRLRPHVSS